MKNNLVRILAAAALGSWLLLAPAKRADALDFYLYGGIDYSPFCTTATRTAGVQSVPESIRNVPSHPDDAYKNPSNGPISDSSFALPIKNEDFNVELTGGIGIREGILDIRVGSRAGLFPEDVVHSDSWIFNLPVKERNYLNAPGTEKRGEGAALTYYGLNLEDSNLNLGAFARASLVFDISEGNKVFYMKPFIDYSAMYSPRKFFIETGWDRYNSLEVRDKNYLTSGMINHLIKVGIEIATPLVLMEAYSGIEIPQVITTSLADKTGFTFDSKPSFSWGLRMGFSLSSEWELK